jgi:hypothetical protein
MEGLSKLKKSNDLIGNRAHDLPACSIVPQPTTLPRAPSNNNDDDDDDNNNNNNNNQYLKLKEIKIQLEQNSIP